MVNKFGKTSKLMIKARFNNEKTVLEDVAFTAPFKIMKPFYENQDLMTIMCLLPLLVLWKEMNKNLKSLLKKAQS